MLAQTYIREGYEWGVDIDLEKFFDRVHHDRLMAVLSRDICDKRVLHLIRRFLTATRRTGGKSVEQVVDKLQQLTRGWRAYFGLAEVSRASA